MVKEISLTQGQVAIVDDEDYDYLSQFKWHARRDDNTWYAIHSDRINGRIVETKMHRLVLPPPDGFLVDHKNRNGLDNRRCNLRIATISQNTVNSPTRNKTGYRGVKHSTNPRWWEANIRVNRKKVYLGCFPSPEQAARAYDDAARKYHGEFAILNFPT